MATDLDAIRLHFGEGGLAALDGVLALVVLGVALDLRPGDLRRAIAAPRALAVGLAAQFLVFPAVTFALVMALRPPPSVALGMMLVAACPAGSLSNFLAHLARANTALSISLSAASTIAAVVLTPLLVSLWGSLDPATAPLLREVTVDPLRAFGSVALVLGLPLAAGRLIAARAPALAERARRPMKVLSIAAFVAFAGTALALNADAFRRAIGAIAGLVALQDAAALAAGYATARAVGLDERDARAVALECGIRNSGLGLALVFAFFGGLGGMAVVAAWWGCWHVVSGLALAAWWARREPLDRAGVRERVRERERERERGEARCRS
jgi:BASS family bile acid:Na+ symporter